MHCPPFCNRSPATDLPTVQTWFWGEISQSSVTHSLLQCFHFRQSSRWKGKIHDIHSLCQICHWPFLQGTFQCNIVMTSSHELSLFPSTHLLENTLRRDYGCWPVGRANPTTRQQLFVSFVSNNSSLTVCMYERTGNVKFWPLDLYGASKRFHRYSSRIAIIRLICSNNVCLNVMLFPRCSCQWFLSCAVDVAPPPSSRPPIFCFRLSASSTTVTG